MIGRFGLERYNDVIEFIVVSVSVGKGAGHYVLIDMGLHGPGLTWTWAYMDMSLHRIVLTWTCTYINPQIL